MALFLLISRTRLEGDVGAQRAVGTGEEEALEADLVLVSIGYKGVPIAGTEPWFDEQRGVLKNTHGLVDASTEDSGGLYTAGWLKRGPSGIIGTNIPDAKDTVSTILHDMERTIPQLTDSSSIQNLLDERGVKVVDWQAYQRIDTAEQNEERKRHPDQPREKLTTTDELLQAAEQ